ncbi:MAG: methyltransferase domain-containing protein, partial [Streptosporangiaceae bacterium]
DGSTGGSTGGSAAPGLPRSGPGVLPDSAAGAMIQLAGAPPGRRDRTLIDPCCGTGAVLAQALAAGWSAAGTDIDPAAVAAAAARLPGADVQLGDARELLLADDSVAACASWLPAGGPPGGWDEWAMLALAELSRVTRSGGPVVLLAPGLPRSAIPAALRLRRQVPLRLAGGMESIWAFRRA